MIVDLKNGHDMLVLQSMQNLEFPFDTLQLSIAVPSRRDTYCLACKDRGRLINFLHGVHIAISPTTKVIYVLVWILLECTN
jgi:hypothetical protein